MNEDTLLRKIEGCQPIGRRTRLMAIDGCGGAGKSSLAKRLSEQVADAQIVGVDDFWLPRVRRPERDTVIAEPGSDYDWTRLRDQVIAPLSRDEDARYQRYDWETDTLAEWHDVASGGTVIVEGVFTTRSELLPYYDLKVWVETPASLCLERGIVRDGEQHRDLWENEWMKAYEAYIDISDPKSRADIVVVGS